MQPKNPDDVLNAILETVREAQIVATGAKIDAAPGALTEYWIAKTSLPHGAALLALTGFDRSGRLAESTVKTGFSLGFFLFAAQARASRAAKALEEQAFQFMQLIDRNRWRLEGAEWPTHITARNAFSPTLLEKQSSLWMIEWKQAFLIDEGRQTQTHKALFGET